MVPQRLAVLSLVICFGLASSSVDTWSQRTPVVPRSAEIRGQVRLPDGRPASRGIPVTLDMRTSGTATETQTDSQGKFQFRQVPQAVYKVRVHVIGYQDEVQEVDLTAIPTSYVTFVLRPDPSRKDPSIPPGGPAASISVTDANAPPSARDDLEIARQLMTTGKDLDKSITLLKKAVGEYPKYAEAYLLMGVAYSSKKKWDDAETSLQKSVELNQQNGAAYVALGAVENEKKKYPEAEKYLLKAVALSPDSADVHSELGRTYWALSRWQEADQHMAKAIQLRPDDASAHVLMGNIQLRERNAEGALKEFQEAVRLDPKGPYADSTRQMITRIETALKQAQNQSK